MRRRRGEEGEGDREGEEAEEAEGGIRMCWQGWVLKGREEREEACFWGGGWNKG